MVETTKNCKSDSQNSNHNFLDIFSRFRQQVIKALKLTWNSPNTYYMQIGLWN